MSGVTLVGQVRVHWVAMLQTKQTPSRLYRREKVRS